MVYTRNTSKMDIVPFKGVRKLKEACGIIQYYYNCSKATILSIEDVRHPQSVIFYQQIMMSLWSGKTLLPTSLWTNRADVRSHVFWTYPGMILMIMFIKLYSVIYKIKLVYMLVSSFSPNFKPFPLCNKFMEEFSK